MHIVQQIDQIPHYSKLLTLDDMYQKQVLVTHTLAQSKFVPSTNLKKKKKIATTIKQKQDSLN